MPPVVPAEMIGGAVQMVIYFISAVGVLFGLFLAGRG